MTIQLNGTEHSLEENTSVTGLLNAIGLGDKPVVVERNKEALFPREFATTILENGDQLEVITIAAGG
ncbi:sulfur carrier protein ThiS [Verrucomicrobiaceae bacterium R5-34]|nr:sulfur carrier protein ThiS [Verrucomicrobiaceae bacterium R5-34]